MDNLLFGSTKVTIKTIRAAMPTVGLPTFLKDVRRALLTKHYRAAFAAYHLQFIDPGSMTRIDDFQYGDDALRLEQFLNELSWSAPTQAQRVFLSDRCAVHHESKQLRLYAAVLSLEDKQPARALWQLLTVPYLSEGAPDRHYFVLDFAAIRQALDLDPRGTERTLTLLRRDVIHKIRFESPPFKWSRPL